MLDLNAQYALAWLNMGVFMIAPLLVTVIQLQTNIQDVIKAAQEDAQRLCNTTSNAMLGDSIDGSNIIVQNMGRLLIFMVDVVEAIILWIVNAYKSTYRCLLGLAVNGALSAVTKITGPIQNAAEGILSGIESGKQAVGNLFTGKSSASDHVELGNWTDSMQEVQDKVSNWTTGDDPLDQLIRAPFEKVKQQIHDNVLSWKPSNVPSFDKVCDLTSISEGLDGVQNQLLFITRVLMGILVSAAIIAVVVNVLWIRKRHQKNQKRVRNLAFELVAAAPKEGDMRGQRKNIEKKLMELNSALSGGTKRWWVDYLTQPLVVYCLVVGLLGIIMTFATKAAIHHTLSGSSMDLRLYQVDGVNAWIADAEADINERTFGAVRQAALSANDTVSMVTDHISQFLKRTLGGTVFEEPAKDVLDCLFMTKIQQLENGLTWITQSTYVNLTRVDGVGMQEWRPAVERQITAKLEQDLAFYWALVGVWGVCLCTGLVLQFQKHLTKGRA